VKVYDDFLFSDPTDDQIHLWDAYLTNGASRTSMVSAILNSQEFRFFWTIGVYDHYLGSADLSDPEVAAANSALNASGNYLATEISVLSSASYFSLHGGTNAGWVAGIFQDALQRSPDATGAAYWTQRLDAGSSRSSAATTILRSTESAKRRVSGTAGATSCASIQLTDDAALSSGSYCIVLDRLADPSGASYWSSQLAGSDQLPSLWAALAGSSEYFNNAQP
jgi:hypothetical protein